MQIKNIKRDNQKMNERRSIEVIKNGLPKKSPRSLAVIKNGRPKESPCSSAVIKKGLPKKSPYPSTVIENGCPKKLACSSAIIKKNDRPKKLAHFQDQAIIPRMSKKTFKRQILRGRHRNTNIPEEESS